jgi:hypothetical protein
MLLCHPASANPVLEAAAEERKVHLRPSTSGSEAASEQPVQPITPHILIFVACDYLFSPHPPLTCGDWGGCLACGRQLLVL